MIHEKDTCSVLIVSAGQKTSLFFTELLPPNKFFPILSAPTVGAARRLLVDRGFDIIIINTPLPDDFGVQFAMETAQNQNCGILLFVAADLQDAISQKVEDLGILTLSRPINRQMIFQSIKLLVATRQRIKALEAKATTLQNKMEEIRLVNRAKLLLIEHLNMSEAEAHRYIEKTAMDNCVKRREIAENIIKTYEN